MLHILVTNPHETHEFSHDDGPLEFGRGPAREATRCVIRDGLVSTDQVRVEILAPGRLRVENLSGRDPLRIGRDELVAPGDVAEIALPAQITIGRTLVEISEEDSEGSSPAWVRAFLEKLGRNGLLFVDEVSEIESLLRASSSSQEFARGFALGRQLQLRKELRPER
jgi:hypothetical protein